MCDIHESTKNVEHALSHIADLLNLLGDQMKDWVAIIDDHSELPDAANHLSNALKLVLDASLEVTRASASLSSSTITITSPSDTHYAMPHNHSHPTDSHIHR
ncbi:hypothetical protein Sulac_3570 (plasmid) [Sulfobacillus acidophilus DSM 10332]|uniref:Uncharacterized protein n=1 Tax=Sulfobacillus acidophilus (strain ATCC 700253 / DSM 10332 / NAL) TaxID=679936 RepID=G8U1S2_SULAD|nr:hypothetical protein Sulac_3570 [Sulfobacillus acidophilus DSM 10332]